MPVTGLQSVASLCVPVTVRQLTPQLRTRSGLWAHVYTSEPVVLLLLHTTVASLMQLHAPLKPVFCFVIIMFITMIFAVTLGRRFL